MALRSMRRRCGGILLAGACVLLAAVPAQAASVALGGWTHADLYGGTAFSIAASPVDPSIVLAGSGGNGVFRSTDGGATWRRSSAGLPHDIFVFALVFAPSAPGTVFAGTDRTGVYRSTDSGQTWVRITAGLDIGSFFSIAVDPHDAARLFISSGIGVWRTTDGGSTWTSLTWPGTDNIDAEAIAIAPSDPQIVYAISSSPLRSVDGGATWTYLDSVPNAASVWVDPADANNLLVGGSDGVYRSTDGGASFKLLATIGSYNVVNALVPDPAVPDRFWAGTYSAGLFRSDDDGVTWHRNSAGLPANRTVHGIAFTSTGMLCAVAQFGVFHRSTGSARWTSSSTGIRGSQVNALVVAPSNSAVLYAGLAGQGLFRSTDGGTTWSYRGLRGQNVNSIAVSPIHASTIWAAATRGVWRSRDGGQRWVKQFAAPTQEMQAVAVAPSSPATIYATSFDGGTFRSTDSGSSWHRLRLPGWIVTLCILVDPANASRIWVGTRFAGIERSVDGGRTWTQGAGGPPSGYDAVELAIDPHNHSRLYAAAGPESGLGVFISTNSGRTWTRASGPGAPNSAMTVAVDPTTPGRIYAGTDNWLERGLSRSDDSGATWHPINAGLSVRAARSLAVQRSGVVHLGTTAYGGGSGGGIFTYRPAA